METSSVCSTLAVCRSLQELNNAKFHCSNPDVIFLYNEAIQMRGEKYKFCLDADGRASVAVSAELCGLWWRNKYTIVIIIITIIIILMLILICTGSGAPFFLPPHPLTVASQPPVPHTGTLARVVLRWICLVALWLRKEETR